MWQSASSSSVAARGSSGIRRVEQPACRSASTHRVEALRPLGMLAALQMLAADRVRRRSPWSRPYHTPRRLPYRSTCSRGLKRKPSSLQISASHSARSRKRAGVRALRHQDDALAIGRERRHQVAHFRQIVRLRDHELQLIVIALHQLRKDVRLDPQALVLRRPAALRRGVGELRTDAHQVAGDRLEHGARRSRW